MAPELLRGDSGNTTESDMYAFGIVLYEIFSRKKPYESQDPNETLSLIADRKARHRPPTPTSCPPDITSLMKKCLLDDAKARPTADQVQKRLKYRRSESAKQAESILCELFPPDVATALREGRKLEPEAHPSVTLFFADIDGYRDVASSLTQKKLQDLLDRLYSKFRRLCDLHHVFEIKIMGDAYMAATNLVEKQPEHVSKMARFALDALEAANGTLIDESDPSKGHIQIRIGLHTGPLAAHAIGSRNPRYSIIGETVNIALKMECTSKSGRIQCTAAVANVLKEHCPDLDIIRRGKQAINDQVAVEAYWIKFSPEEFSEVSDTPDRVLESSSSLALSKAEQERSRLVNWNVAVLQKYLCAIVKYRTVSDSTLKQMVNAASELSYDVERMDGMLLDEVQEIIDLPTFNARAVMKMRQPEDVELPVGVMEELEEYVTTISLMYRENPFHSFQHASHVSMSLDKLLASVVSPKELDHVDAARRDHTLHEYTYGISSDPLAHFAFMFSALIHDVDHPGVPNAVLVKEKNRLSSLYKEKSVAEQNSISLAWQLLMQPEFGTLRSVIAPAEVEMARFRQLVINVVLATDIVDRELKDLRNKRWEDAFSETARLDDSPEEHVNRKATIVMEHLIQASDVAHTMQHWHLYRKWNERFFEECYEAYVRGRVDNDPSLGWYKGELGFFDFYIIPLTLKLKDCGVFGASSSEYYNCALRNRAEWEVRGQEVVAEVKEKVQAKLKHAKGSSRNASSLSMN
eukprot:scaffold1341_cov178-Amphora_coffeaeformis.AAC.21